MNFIFIVVPSLIVCIIMKLIYKHDITIKEFLCHFGCVIVVSLLMIGITYISLYTSMGDTEVLNGKVLDKYNHNEICTQYSSCRHYVLREKCKTYIDSKGKVKESCVSYKVFDYPYEVDWYVKTSIDTYEISRADRQGVVEPKRWYDVNIGDPASDTHYYINYLLGNKDSLFHSEEYKTKYSDEYKKSIPDYPKIYDYYKINHVINLTNLNDDGYNLYLSNALRDMGSQKQVNIIVIMYPYKNNDFIDATLMKWNGGKKNDVIVFLGLDDTGIVKNFRSTSFANGINNEILHSTLKMDVISEKLSIDTIEKIVYDINKYFNRMPNAEFEYLKYKLEPSTVVVVICALLTFIGSIMFGLYMRKIDL